LLFCIPFRLLFENTIFLPDLELCLFAVPEGTAYGPLAADSSDVCFAFFPGSGCLFPIGLNRIGFLFPVRDARRRLIFYRTVFERKTLLRSVILILPISVRFTEKLCAQTAVLYLRRGLCAC
jgi:hypothetical protein